MNVQNLVFFLGFQYPVEVPGVTNGSFLRLAYNTVQGARGKDELDPLEFDDFIQSKLNLLGMDASFLERSLNDGFFGRRKKNGMKSSRWLFLNPHWQY